VLPLKLLGAAFSQNDTNWFGGPVRKRVLHFMIYK
jgi:hypothetical protein